MLKNLCDPSSTILLVPQGMQALLHATSNMIGFAGKIYITGPGSGDAENGYSFQEDLCELRNTRPAFKAQMYRNV